MKDMIVSILTTLLGLPIFIQGIRFMFSPTFRLNLKRQHLKEKLQHIRKLNILYIHKDKKLNNELQYEINMLLGTDKYHYRLVLYLLEKNIHDIEKFLRDIDTVWFLLKEDYSKKTIIFSLRYGNLKHYERLSYLFLFAYIFFSLIVLFFLLTQLVFFHLIEVLSMFIILFCIAWITHKLNIIIKLGKYELL